MAVGNIVWHMVSIALFISYVHPCQQEWRTTVVLKLGVIHSFLYLSPGFKSTVSIEGVGGAVTTRVVDWFSHPPQPPTFLPESCRSRCTSPFTPARSLES